jgi:hypothetical protein
MIEQGNTPLFDALGPLAKLQLLKAAGEVSGRTGTPAQAEALLISSEEAAKAMLDPVASSVHKVLQHRFEDPTWHENIIRKTKALSQNA